MPRKKVSRALPPLPNHHDLDEAAHKTERLTEILRKVAFKNQRTQPRAFYSVREVARSFHVTLSTACRAYGHLEQEGLLTRVRGSKTLLQGRHYDRRLEVRAFVGLPACLSSFITIQAYRNFFIKIRRELRLRGFATAMVFCEKDETQTAELSERLKTYEVDTVIWFQPPREAAKTAQWLADFGIRVIGIAHGGFPSIPCRYDIRRDQGIKKLLTAWKTHHAVTHVTLAQSGEEPSFALDEIARDTLDHLGINSTVARFQGERTDDFLRFMRALQKSRTDGIIFPSAQLPSKLCFRAPDAVADLLRTRRVAFFNGPVTMPFLKVPDVQVDLVVVDWQRVAEQIVDDLISQAAFQQAESTVVHAEAKLGVPLSQLAHTI
jgi:hypothetical protein